MVLLLLVPLVVKKVMVHDGLCDDKNGFNYIVLLRSTVIIAWIVHAYTAATNIHDVGDGNVCGCDADNH